MEHSNSGLFRFLDPYSNYLSIGAVNFFRFHNSKNEVEWYPMRSGGNPFFTFERSVPKDGVMVWAGVIGNGRKLPLVIFPPGTRITAAVYLQYVFS
jgi:hypothetical protein